MKQPDSRGTDDVDDEGSVEIPLIPFTSFSNERMLLCEFFLLRYV